MIGQCEVCGQWHTGEHPKAQPLSMSMFATRADFDAAQAKQEAQQEARKGALDELARENERLGLSYADAPQQEAQGAMAWRAEPIMAGYQLNGYKIVRGEEEPIARTIVRDESHDEKAAELLVAALNAYSTTSPQPAPVDMRALRALLERMAAHVRPTCSELYDEARAILDGNTGGNI